MKKSVSKYDIDQILSRLSKSKKLSNKALSWICLSVMKVFKSQPMLLRLPAPIDVCGDIHGQFADLLSIFERCGDVSTQNYLFLGDYVGRGPNSIETISYLFALKVKFPTKIWLLRGNHESEELSRTDGFYQEFEDRGIPETWSSFMEVFNWMPIAAVVGKRIFCVHGGLSPDLVNLREIKDLKRPLAFEDSDLATDLVWSDPQESGYGWRENERGISYVYGRDIVEAFLEKHNLDLLCRAHQAVNGYDFPYKSRSKKISQCCVTVFSAPRYYDDNFGSVLVIEEDLTCKFEMF